MTQLNWIYSLSVYTCAFPTYQLGLHHPGLFHILYCRMHSLFCDTFCVTFHHKNKGQATSVALHNYVQTYAWKKGRDARIVKFWADTKFKTTTNVYGLCVFCCHLDTMKLSENNNWTLSTSSALHHTTFERAQIILWPHEKDFFSWKILIR